MLQALEFPVLGVNIDSVSTANLLFQSKMWRILERDMKSSWLPLFPTRPSSVWNPSKGSTDF